MTIQTTARNTDLQGLVTLLEDLNTRKVDVVVPATSLRSKNGLIVVKGAEAQIDEDGVTTVDGIYTPTAVFDEGVSKKLDIPVGYVRRLRNDRPDLYDANVNGWLHGKSVRKADGTVDSLYAPDGRSFLFRGYRGGDGEGVARTLLSNSYGIMDNYDALFAALAGIRDAGVEVDIVRCDLTDRHLYVQVSCPAVAAMAPELLKGYRSPFGGGDGASLPVVYAGFVLRNSEVGDGAYNLAPQIRVRVCSNGMTVLKDAVRQVHIGSKLDDGVIKWSRDTATKQAELVTAKTRDAVKTFLSQEWLDGAVADVERKAGAEVHKAAETVPAVIASLGFTKTVADGILDHFIKGGQGTAAGVAQAMTSYSQTVDDADLAYDLDAKAIEAMEVVYAAAK